MRTMEEALRSLVTRAVERLPQSIPTAACETDAYARSMEERDTYFVIRYIRQGKILKV